MTATVTPIRRTVRAATPARWQAALRRALAEGCQLRQLATSGVAVVTSGTDASLAYVVTGADCECRAAQEGDPVCKHRALYWHRNGVLDPEPEPGAPAPAAPADGGEPYAPYVPCDQSGWTEAMRADYRRRAA